jgi:quinolinate synthase
MTTTVPLTDRLAELKASRQAVILAHNYQPAEVQDVADFVGDSLGLSQQAAKADAAVIVFAGVYFMAETAKIVCPEATVLIPDENAGCPMANMITPRQLAQTRRQHPDAAVVCYVNSSAAVKAMSDICCTSSNATRVVESIPRDREVLFIPDKSLGRYVSEQLDRELILWPGYCPTHHRILASDIKRIKAEHPDARVVVHPECTKEVVELADAAASTSGILAYARESDASEFVIGTEVGILHRLRKENPDKTFYPASPLSDCPNMKLTTLEKLVWSLEDMAHEVRVQEDIAENARLAIQRMLDLS